MNTMKVAEMLPLRPQAGGLSNSRKGQAQEQQNAETTSHAGFSSAGFAF
jgi:hypothetical protein